MMILLKEEKVRRTIDIDVDVDVDVFMLAIKAIRNAEARNDLWRFCAVFR